MRKSTLVKSICIAMGILGTTMGTSFAAPVQVTGNTDLSWTKQDGTYQFADGLVFTDFSQAAHPSHGVDLSRNVNEMTMIVGSSLTLRPEQADTPNEFTAITLDNILSGQSEHLTVEGGTLNVETDVHTPTRIQVYHTVGVTGGHSLPARAILDFNNKETNLVSKASGTEADPDDLGALALYMDQAPEVNFRNEKTTMTAIVSGYSKAATAVINVSPGMLNMYSKDVTLRLQDDSVANRSSGETIRIQGDWQSPVPEAPYGMTIHEADNFRIQYEANHNTDFAAGLYMIGQGNFTAKEAVKNLEIETIYHGNGNENATVEAVSVWDNSHAHINAKNTTIKVTSTDPDATMVGAIRAVLSYIKSDISFDGDKLTVEEKNMSNQPGIALMAIRGGLIKANANDMTIKARTGEGSAAFRANIAAYAYDKSRIYINSDENGADQGKTLRMEGGLVANNKSTLMANLTNDQSRLDGWSIVSPEGDCVLDMAVENGARWNLMNDSTLTTFTGKNGGIVDMTVNPADADDTYQLLKMDNLKGEGDVFIMDTDLDSQTDGDKIYINKTAETGKHFIQVKDVSADKGAEVKGRKKLLLVKDASGNSVFEGQTYHGLWDIEPTVEKIGNDWYLVKVVHYDNPETETGVGNVESAYAFWRAGILDDTLRQRLGDVRYHKQDDGVWARFKTGKLQAPLYDGSYQMYQVGYDKRHNRDIYGIALDHTRGKTNHSMGQAKNRNIGITLYDTNYRDDNTYSDLVLRVGRIRNDLRMYDGKASNTGDMDYKVWGYSASYELGKTHRKDHGWFYEPQAQLIYGRLPGGTYHTNKGLKIRKDAIDSLLGRAGIVAGRQLHENSDFYIKANLYHEFLGDDDMYFELAGQKLHREIRHRDTWYNLGLGCNILLDKDVSVYGDVERTFHADIRKKWQANVGLRYGF